MTINTDGPPDPFTGHLDVAFGEAVLLAMFRKGITQTQVAAELHISQSAFSRKLRGYTAWTLFDMIGTARTLDMPLFELMPEAADWITFGDGTGDPRELLRARRYSKPQPSDP